MIEWVWAARLSWRAGPAVGRASGVFLGEPEGSTANIQFQEVVVAVLQTELTHFSNQAEAPVLDLAPGIEAAVLSGLHGEQVMMVINTTQPGCGVSPHSHPHEQIGIVLEGEATYRIGDEERIVEKGDVYHVPANVPHCTACIGDEPTVMLEVFYPVREDFLARIRAGGRWGADRPPF
jgi:unsaturated pyranuronate lyase